MYPIAVTLLLVTAIFCERAAYTFPHSGDADDFGFDSHSERLAAIATAPNDHSLLFRFVQTPMSDKDFAFDEHCPDRAPNCERTTLVPEGGEASPGNGGDTLEGTPLDSVFRYQAARRGAPSAAGYAYFNWSSRPGGALQPTGHPRIHTVNRGETLRSIAQRGALPRWQCIYDRRINPELVDRRRNPDRIQPGDIVRLPDICEGKALYGGETPVERR